MAVTHYVFLVLLSGSPVPSRSESGGIEPLHFVCKCRSGSWQYRAGG